MSPVIYRLYLNCCYVTNMWRNKVCLYLTVKWYHSDSDLLCWNCLVSVVKNEIEVTCWKWKGHTHVFLWKCWPRISFFFTSFLHADFVSVVKNEIEVTCWKWKGHTHVFLWKCWPRISFFFYFFSPCRFTPRVAKYYTRIRVLTDTFPITYHIHLWYH